MKWNQSKDGKTAIREAGLLRSFVQQKEDLGDTFFDGEVTFGGVVVYNFVESNVENAKQSCDWFVSLMVQYGLVQYGHDYLKEN
jgi:hypothetical protein